MGARKLFPGLRGLGWGCNGWAGGRNGGANTDLMIPWGTIVWFSWPDTWSG